MRRPALLAVLPLLAAPLAVPLAASLTLGAPAGAAPAAGPDYHLYVTDVYGADLGACREPARKGTAWKIRGLVDATGVTSTTNPRGYDIGGGLVVVRPGGEETGNRWVARKVAPGTTATGAVVVARSARVQVQGFVGTDGAGDSFTKAPAQVKPC